MKIVEGFGPTNAQIAIIGEAPGRNEEQQGRPFVGPAGQELDRWLSSVGISRHECYLDNVMQVRPPGNKFTHFYDGTKPTEELERGRRRLINRLLEINPNVVCLLGNEALKTITGQSGISKWRGSIIPTQVGKAIPTFHPSYIRRLFPSTKGRNLAYSKALAIMDMRKVLAESKFEHYDEPFLWENLSLPRTCHEVLQLLDIAIQSKLVSIDLETIYGRPMITRFGFAWDSDHAASILFMDSKGQPVWTQEEELRIWDKISQLCSTPNKKVFQNAQFDIPILNRHGFVVSNLWMDTMIAHSCVYPELPKNLDLLTSIYTNIPFYSDLKKGSQDEFGYYNCLDCLATWRCAPALVKQLDLFGTADLYFKHMHLLIEPVKYMQELGIRVDTKRRQQEKERLENIRDNLSRQLETLVGQPVNVKSIKDMKSVLIDKLNLPPIHKRGTGKLTFNEDALLKMHRKNPHDALTLIIQIRFARTILSGFYNKPIDEDNRLRCSWNIVGTVSSRWSSSATAWGTGMNLQNIPRDERIWLIPDKGNEITYADLAQADMRVVAWRAGVSGMKRAFQQGKDLHKINCTIALGVPLEQVNKEQRQMTKHLGHAANYVVGPRTFSSTLDKKLRGTAIKASLRHQGALDHEFLILSETEAKQAIDQYHGCWWEIPRWHEEIKGLIYKTRTLETPMGRKRTFFGPVVDATIREAISWEPQSVVGDIINRCVIALWSTISDECSLLVQSHDAIALQNPPEEREYIKSVLTNATNIPLYEDMVIPIEIKHGQSWGEVED